MTMDTITQGTAIRQVTAGSIRAGAMCPTCKRRMPGKKVDSRICKDRALVSAAIQVCESAMTNPWFANIRQGIGDERRRLQAMLDRDLRLMWRVYRRKDKGAPYYDVASDAVGSVGEIA